MRLLRRRRYENGFSLVEVLVALTLFTIMTLGLIPLIALSVKGAADSLSYTVGKNVVSEAMERARGLPYYVSFNTQPKQVDLLDLYFPKYFNPSNQYTTTCTSTSTNPACPSGIPSGYTLTFQAKFVTAETDTPQTFKKATVPTTYAWNSTTADMPPSQLLSLNVTGTWNQAGPQSFDLESLFSNRRFNVTQPVAATASPAPVANLKLRALGRIRYVVQADTGYDYPAGKSEMTVIVDASLSRMEQGTSIMAEQSSRSFDAKIIRPPTGSSTAATDVATLAGAASYAAAPPDYTGSNNINLADLQHPDSGGPNLKAAGHGDTTAFSYASLNYFGANNSWDTYNNVLGFNYNDTNGNKIIEMYMKNQMSTAAPLRLVSSRNTLQVQQQSANSDQGGSPSDPTGLMYAFSIADANDIATNKKVLGYAQAKAWDIFFLPVSFAPNSPANQALIHIQNFAATLNCISTGNPSTASATASWSATLKYWKDSTNDGALNGSYQTVSLAGNLGTDPLQAIKTSNPLVYDGSTASADVYLFDDPATSKEGYLTDWNSIATIPTSEDAAGKVTTAQLMDAIRISTVPLTPSIPESDVSVAIGNMECVAEDYR